MDINKIKINDEKVAAVKKVAVEQYGADVRSVQDITGHSASDVYENLTKVFIKEQLFTPNYQFILTQLFGMEELELGSHAFDYNDYTDGSTRRALDNNSIDDFNADLEPVLREIWEVDKSFHKKVKMLDIAVNDTLAFAVSFMEVVAEGVKSITYALEKMVENEYWTKVFAEGEVVPVTGTSMDVQETMYQELTTYGTTSRNHKGIGTDGVITVSTVNGDIEITQDQRFNSADFYLLETPEQKTSIVYNGAVPYIRWEEQELPLAGRITVDFSIYSGVKEIEGVNDAGETVTLAPAVTIPEGTVSVLIHKSALKGFKHFDYSSVVKGASAFSVDHMFSEYGVYVQKNVPMLVFTLTEVTEPVK